jgi:hypothetical protein
MMEIIKADRGPLIHIHFMERTVHGNGIAIKVYGEMKIAAKEYVYARELKLNTIETLHLEPHTGSHRGYMTQKWIYNKGEYGNYASIDVFDHAGNEITAGSQYAPEDGSIWLDFIALGE